MNQLLTPNQTVSGDSSGLRFVIKEFLGGGSQGEVYRASAQDATAAIKWFYPRYVRQDKRLRERLERAVDIGAPSNSFLWPIELTSADDCPGFGYLMALREPRYRGMADLVTRKYETTFRALATAGYELSNAFLQLHAKGLCYRDISFGNVFFDPASGQVRICDNDNVDIDGQPGAIGGTARFMAPELVTGAGKPNTQSDLFSLAILLFYLLINHHPLEGALESQIRCFDLPAMTKLYGSDPIFVYDPNNAANRPVPGQHDNAIALWPIYPEFVQTLFTRAFTDGVRDPQQGRVRESEWRSAMVQLRDAIFYCTACRAENFYEPAFIREHNGRLQTEQRCWSCDQRLVLPLRIRITQGADASVVMLNHDTQLFPHHIDGNNTWRFDQPVAEIRRHPKQEGVWGLANLSDREWSAANSSNETFTIPSGRSVTLVDGVRIYFGSSEGEIRL